MKMMTVEELKSKLDRGVSVRLLDVREPYEHEEYNIGGTLIPLGQLTTRVNELAAWQSDEVVVYCRSGQRSQMAQRILLMNDFNDVSNLTGGMIDWADKIDSDS